MIREIIKFNCHVLKVLNHDNNVNIENLKRDYQNKILIFEGVEVYVDNVKWSSNKSTILTTVKHIERK
jgi:hypothetical protein